MAALPQRLSGNGERQRTGRNDHNGFAATHTTTQSPRMTCPLPTSASRTSKERYYVFEILRSSRIAIRGYARSTLPVSYAVHIAGIHAVPDCRTGYETDDQDASGCMTSSASRATWSEVQEAVIDSKTCLMANPPLTNATSAQPPLDNALPPCRAEERGPQKTELQPIGEFRLKLLYEGYGILENPFGMTPDPHYL